MTRRSLSIIVPAKDEAGNITAALEGVLWAAERARLDEYEVILVDDGSVDATLMTARHTVRSPFLRTVRHPSNLGLRAAYETGLGLATHTYVTWAPGDGEIARESLLEVFRAVGTADIVAIYHDNPQARAWFRRLLTFVSTLEMNVLFGHRKAYFQGANVYPVALARCLPRTESGFFFCAEMYLAALDLGFDSVEIPITHRERTYGTSSAVGWRRIWDAQMAVFKFFYRLKLRRAPLPRLDVAPTP